MTYLYIYDIDLRYHNLHYIIHYIPLLFAQVDPDSEEGKALEKKRQFKKCINASVSQTHMCGKAEKQ